MDELRFEELTTRQKIGILLAAHADPVYGEDDFSYLLELIRDRSLGAVFISPLSDDFEARMAAIHAAADYPLLVCNDAESGISPYLIGRQSALACADREDLAYLFGKMVGLRGRELGYNVIFDPVVDMTSENIPCGGTVRCMGPDPARVTALAAAQCRGFHDAGILTVAKHYPGPKSTIDTHMAEGTSNLTEDDLLAFYLKPYLALSGEGLLDGVMTGHTRLPAIDSEYPASLSRKVTDILRLRGFEGFFITDALVMMGIVSKFGAQACKGLSIAGGNDLALAWGPNRISYQALQDAYEQGIITEARMNDAVKRVLYAQHKAAAGPRVSMAPEDAVRFGQINTDCISDFRDEGVSPALAKEGKHCFVVLIENESDMEKDGRLAVDTRERLWYQPEKIAEKLNACFPNSECLFLPQFPSATQNYEMLNRQLAFDDVVFVTFFQSQAYIGRESFTTRIQSVIEALQVTDRISAVVHFGNPFLLEPLAHIPRRIIGCMSYDCTMAAIDVLAGKYAAKGRMPYTLCLQ